MKFLFPATGLFLGAITLISASCSKEVHDVIYQGQRAPVVLRESARNWYLQHRKAKSTDIEEKMLSHYWQKASVMMMGDGEWILVVPLPDPPVNNPKLGFRRFLVFEPSGTHVNSGKIVELLGDKYQVNNQAYLLLTGRAAGIIPGFNGTILQYDVNYNPLYNTNYTDGKANPNMQSAILKTSGKTLRSPIQPHAGELSVSMLRPGRYNVNHRIYSVKDMAPYQTLQIEENDSLIAVFFHHPQNHGKQGGKLAGRQDITYCFRQVLGEARIRQLASSNPGRFLVTLYFAGAQEKVKPVAISFTIFQPDKNSLTLNEIDEVNAYLKKNLVLDIPSSVNREKQVWPFAQAVDFSRLDH